MEDLSKQQLVLLALLVSFVTALATGVVTVSLMDQAPEAVTHTVNQVVERTIQQIIPQDAAVANAPATFQDVSAAAVSAIMKSTVKIVPDGAMAPSGIGIVVSAQGILLADKSSLTGSTGYHATLPNGSSVPIAVVQTQNGGDLVFFAITSAQTASGATTSATYQPITFAKSGSLGQTVLSLSGLNGPVLAQGIVTTLSSTTQATTGPPTAVPISTSISPKKVIPGSVLFTLNGEALGVNTSSLDSSDGAAFYPLMPLRSIIPGK